MSLTYLSGEKYSQDLHDNGTRTVYILVNVIKYWHEEGTKCQLFLYSINFCPFFKDAMESVNQISVSQTFFVQVPPLSFFKYFGPGHKKSLILSSTNCIQRFKFLVPVRPASSPSTGTRPSGWEPLNQTIKFF